MIVFMRVSQFMDVVRSTTSRVRRRLPPSNANAKHQKWAYISPYNFTSCDRTNKSKYMLQYMSMQFIGGKHIMLQSYVDFYSLRPSHDIVVTLVGIVCKMIVNDNNAVMNNAGRQRYNPT